MSKRPSPVLLLLGVCAAAFGALAALGITTMQITVEARPVEPPLSVTVRSEDPVITSAIIALAAVGGVASAGLFVRIFILPIFEMIRLSRIIMRRTRERGDQHQALSKRLQAYDDTLEEEIARNTAILDSIADGVVVRDRTGRVILTNPAAYALLDTDGEFDTSMLGVYRPNQDPSRRKRRLQIGERTISLSAAPVRAGDGEIIGEVLVLRDITDEAIAERTKNNFLNQIGHELRTPLTAIQGFSETLAVGWDKLAKESRERAVKGIYEQTRLLAQIINELIELTAIRSSPGGLRRARIDLHTLIEKTL
ncbi:MAG: PAS domain-containing protein, partial [Chloroflexi bacterium]|nr:PAS domain-containing protein [Chloroflexota bacterium]